MTDGFIYLIASDEQNAAKIGFCREHPEFRLTKLQTGNPAPLRLVAYVTGNRRIEGVIHDNLRDYHIGGEWFRGIDALEAVFTSITYDELGDMIEEALVPQTIRDVIADYFTEAA